MDNKIQIFEDKKIRTAWDEEKEEWYFSVVDVVGVLTDSPNPNNYWKVLKKRLKDEGNESVTNCNQLKLKSPKDGKKYKTDVADTEQLLRIIQSIPSPKAEPFKMWLAQVGKERIEETIDPELAIDRALETSTTDISKEEHPQGLSENIKVAKRGGNVAKIARQALETETGKSVITSQNAIELNKVVTDLIERVTDEDEN